MLTYSAVGCNFIIGVNGAVAQLGERCVRNAEAEGSTPFGSTKAVHDGELAVPCNRQSAVAGSIP